VDIGSTATTATFTDPFSTSRRKEPETTISDSSFCGLFGVEKIALRVTWRKPVSAHVGRSHIAQFRRHH
jgi:hypothetical protein